MVGGALVANAAWLISAGESICHRDFGAEAAQAVAYVRNHPRTRFRVSSCRTALAAARGQTFLPANALNTHPPPRPPRLTPDEVVFSLSEGVLPSFCSINDPAHPGRAPAPREVNSTTTDPSRLRSSGGDDLAGARAPAPAQAQ